MKKMALGQGNNMSHIKRGVHSWTIERQSAGNSEDIENLNFIFPCTDSLKYLNKGKDEQLFSQQAIMKDTWKNWKVCKLF